MNSMSEELRKHVELLERRLRIVMAAVAICVVALGVFAVSAFRAQDKPTQLLRATRIEVVNDKGEVVAVIDGASTMLRVGPEDDAHVTITAERGRPQSAEQPARTAKASVTVSNSRTRITRTNIDDRTGASLSVDGENAGVVLGYWASSKSNPNLVWLLANSMNSSARLEHVSGSKISLFADDNQSSWLGLYQGNRQLCTLGADGTGPSLTMRTKDGKLVHRAGAPMIGREDE